MCATELRTISILRFSQNLGSVWEICGWMCMLRLANQVDSGVHQSEMMLQELFHRCLLHLKEVV